MGRALKLLIIATGVSFSQCYGLNCESKRYINILIPAISECDFICKVPADLIS